VFGDRRAGADPVGPAAMQTQLVYPSR
jgi:hypothetical protein